MLTGRATLLSPRARSSREGVSGAGIGSEIRQMVSDKFAVFGRKLYAQRYCDAINLIGRPLSTVSWSIISPGFPDIGQSPPRETIPPRAPPCKGTTPQHGCHAHATQTYHGSTYPHHGRSPCPVRRGHADCLIKDIQSQQQSANSCYKPSAFPSNKNARVPALANATPCRGCAK